MGFESIFKKKAKESELGTTETSDMKLLEELRASRHHYTEVSALSKSRLRNQDYTGSVEKQELERQIKDFEKELQDIDARILETKKQMGEER